jgi:hypothetical protein
MDQVVDDAEPGGQRPGRFGFAPGQVARAP